MKIKSETANDTAAGSQQEQCRESTYVGRTLRFLICMRTYKWRGHCSRNSQMATRTEPNLRLVNVSHDLVDDASDSAQRAAAGSHDTVSTPAASALADSRSGEIRN